MFVILYQKKQLYVRFLMSRWTKMWILLGVIGFIFMFVFDILSMKQKVVLKYVFGIFGLVLLIFSIVQISFTKSSLNVSMSLLIIGYVLFALSMSLLIYSVFYEVGFKQTYKKQSEFELVTDGTYRLTRHPGVLWLFIVFLSISLMFQNYYMLIAGGIWTITNCIYVCMQEKFIFVKVFTGYKDYQESTPMILPNITSIKKTLQEKNWRKL